MKLKKMDTNIKIQQIHIYPRLQIVQQVMKVIIT